jgi:hypothetical protein
MASGFLKVFGMHFDWQTIAVALIVLAALLYTGRRALTRLRSMRAGRAGAAVPACGNCPSEKPAALAQAPRVLVQIDRSPANSVSRSPRRG